MALIAMTVHDTDENQRTELTIKTLDSLLTTVDCKKHRIIVVDNGSCQITKDYLEYKNTLSHVGQGGSFGQMYDLTVITLPENKGTSGGINEAWKVKKEGEHLIKIDNDCIIHKIGWVDDMEEAIERDPSIGIIALKRKDLAQSPDRDDIYQTHLKMLPHESHQKWIVVEDTREAFGTCQMFNYRLIEKIGYMYQPGLYGYDDMISSHRCLLAGFYNCFLPHIEIDHIDNTPTEYWQWKRNEAARCDVEFQRTVHEYQSGKRQIYYNPYEL